MKPDYENYIQFKGWDRSSDHPGVAEYSALINKARLSSPATILEVGFGAGEFLNWAKDNGFAVYGTEIIPELIERARSAGHNVCLSPAPDSWIDDSSLDAIFGIDVFEHMSVEEARQFLNSMKRLLKPTGSIVLRMPNGQSPWFGRFQYGDLTHVQTYTPSSIAQLAEPLGYEVVFAGNLRPGATSVTQAVRRALTYSIRNLVEIILGGAYFGTRVPMDPNMCVLLRQQKVSEGSEGLT